MKILICLAIALSLSSCTSCWSKPAPSAVCANSAKTLGPVLAVNLGCKNPEAISADLASWLEIKKVCAPETMTPAVSTGELVCPVVTTSLLAYANAKLPAAWGCDVSGSPLPLKSALESLCLDVLKNTVTP